MSTSLTLDLFGHTNDPREDVFFHRSALRGKGFDTLEEGTGVEFNVTRGPKGLRAVSVRITR